MNVDVGSDDENVQVPPNMGKVKRPTHGEKGKEKKPKKEIGRASCRERV